MAFDAFLKIDGIPGESTDSKYPNWIELLSFNHEVKQPGSGSVSSGGSRTAERTEHGTFNIVKGIDKTTPKLFITCCTGTHIKKIEMEVCRAGGAGESRTTYYKVVLEDVIIGQVNSVGRSKGGTATPLPVEEVSFNYGKITWTYTETDHRTGAPMGNVEANWDLATNKGG